MMDKEKEDKEKEEAYITPEIDKLVRDVAEDEEDDLLEELLKE